WGSDAVTNHSVKNDPQTVSKRCCPELRGGGLISQLTKTESRELFIYKKRKGSCPFAAVLTYGGAIFKDKNKTVVALSSSTRPCPCASSSESQPQAKEETVEERLSMFGGEMSVMGKNMAERVMATLQEINSEHQELVSEGEDQVLGNLSVDKMHVKELVLSLILLMQACGPLLAQTAAPDPPDSPGILQRLTERAREAKAKVQDLGGTVLDFVGAYYGDHIQPVTDTYVEWASDIKSSAWEKIQTTFDNYMPKMAD
uniref:apolipoprotein C-IV n=1 Tax=Scatophagus argus TaxID=75038 RepID=UPI001ED7E880